MSDNTGANRVGAVQQIRLPTTVVDGEISATRDDAAGAIAVDVNGEDDDEYSGGKRLPGMATWNYVVMMKTEDDESTDTLVIYTDIEAPADERGSTC